MKEYLTDLVRAAPTPLQARNVVREYLQARILGAMQRAGAMVVLAFHGGTALRFLYGSQRYSEDLDFALERARERYDLHAYLRAIEVELTAEGEYRREYVVDTNPSPENRDHVTATLEFMCMEKEREGVYKPIPCPWKR